MSGQALTLRISKCQVLPTEHCNCPKGWTQTLFYRVKCPNSGLEIPLSPNLESFTLESSVPPTSGDAIRTLSSAQFFAVSYLSRDEKLMFSHASFDFSSPLGVYTLFWKFLFKG